MYLNSRSVCCLVQAVHLYRRSCYLVFGVTTVTGVEKQQRRLSVIMRSYSIYYLASTLPIAY